MLSQRERRARLIRRYLMAATLLVAVLALFPLYSRFKADVEPLAPGVLLGGLDLTADKDPDVIIGHVREVFDRPIGVTFRNRQFPLQPAEIDFTIDAGAMLTEGMQYLDGLAMVDIAVRNGLGLPQQQRLVPLRYHYDEAKLAMWVAARAQEVNAPAIGARLVSSSTVAAAVAGSEPVTATLEAAAETAPAAETEAGATPAPALPFTTAYRWSPGESGIAVDEAASAQAIIDAFTRPTARGAELVYTVTPPPPPGMADLEQQLALYARSFPGTVGIYVEPLGALPAGEQATAAVNGDVAFSAMANSVLGVGVVLMERLRAGVQANNPAAQTLGLALDQALGSSNFFAANQLISWLGDDDRLLGARRITDKLRQAGWTNSYWQTGYEAAEELPPLPTAANRGPVNTFPDPNLQTTPAEMGRLLAEIARCQNRGGRLLATFPDTLLPQECATLLFYLSHVEFRELIWGGLPEPEQQWIVHRHGYSAGEMSDVALIWGPRGPYVLSVFLQKPNFLEFGEGNPVIKEISRLVWSFFEFQTQMGVQLPDYGEPPVLQPSSGYIPAEPSYPPSVANPRGW